MSSPLYTTEILRLAASLSEPHALDREDGCAEVRSPTCGSRVCMTVQLDDDRLAWLHVKPDDREHAPQFDRLGRALLANDGLGSERGQRLRQDARRAGVQAVAELAGEAELVAGHACRSSFRLLAGPAAHAPAFARTPLGSLIA